MDKRLISLTPKGVRFQIELPYEAAELLAASLPGFLQELKAALKRERDRQRKQGSLTVMGSDARSKQWIQLAREIDRESRKQKREANEHESKVITRYAKEVGLPYSVLLAYLTVFRAQRRERIKARRDAFIIRCYFLGLSNAEIAKRLRPHTSHLAVARILNQHKDLIFSLKRLNEERRKPYAIPAQKKPKSKGRERTLDQEFTKQHLKERRAWIRRVSKKACEAVQGLEPSSPEYKQTIAALANRYGVSKGGIRDFIQTHKREKQRREKAKLVAAARDLRKAGKTHAEIGEELGYHEKTVAKWLRDAGAAK